MLSTSCKLALHISGVTLLLAETKKKEKEMKSKKQKKTAGGKHGGI